MGNHNAPQARRYTPETLERLKDRVPEKYLVILGALNAGKSYEQIGADLGLPGGTVRSRLNRARAAAERVLAGKCWRNNGKPGEL